MEKAKVYFIKKINATNLVKIYEKLGILASGKVGVKISTGELGGHNYLKPELIKDLINKVNGTIIECNTAYGGNRMDTKSHLKVVYEHGFDRIAKVDIMDSEGEMKIPCDGKHLKMNIVGKNLSNYDFIINLSHFKGHAMGGFGGAIKNMSIGIASTSGKAYIHSAGKTTDAIAVWNNLPRQEDFLEAMAEAALTIKNYLNEKIVYINVLNNLSVDCDCDPKPEKPCMQDIGILASTDAVAIDKACLDLIWNSNDLGKTHFIERVEKQKGRYIISYAEEIGLGNTQYELIEID